MNNQGRTILILVVVISLLSHISLIFILTKLDNKPSEVIEYRPTYVYNITVNNTIPPVETKPKPHPKSKLEAKHKSQTKHKDVLSEDTYLLAHIINAEARDQPYSGKIAVGNVIMNRVASPKFPNTIRGVIYQENQFSPVTDGSINREPSKDAIRAAEEVMNGKRVVGKNVLYFYNPNTSTNKWIFSREVVTQIGNHAFAI